MHCQNKKKNNSRHFHDTAVISNDNFVATVQDQQCSDEYIRYFDFYCITFDQFLHLTRNTNATMWAKEEIGLDSLDFEQYDACPFNNHDPDACKSHLCHTRIRCNKETKNYSLSINNVLNDHRVINAYCSQTPWMHSRQKYDEALHEC